jgi:LEA14-like dessication related protein
MNRRHCILQTILLSAVLLNAGCSRWLSNYKDLQEPRVSLVSLALKEPNLLAPSFLVRLRVENPNDVSMNLDGADATLALNGQAIAQGISRSPLTLASGAASEVDVEVAAQMLTAVQQLSSLLSENSLQYGVTGHLNVLNWLGPLGRLPFSFEGVLDRDTLLRGL